MVILSVKVNKSKVIAAAVILCAVCAALVLFFSGRSKDVMAKAPGATDADRVRFLQTYGWEVKANPKEVKEVVIPEVFDEVYRNYNEIQKTDGFDLRSYAGCRVKRWTYEVTNYPAEKQKAVANILVYEDKIIGGDICSVALGGFMHGFSQKPKTGGEGSGS